MDDQKAAQLLEKYQRGLCTAKEKAIVESWFLDITKDSENTLPDPDMERLQAQFWDNIIAKNQAQGKTRRLWPRIAAAASILLFLSAGGYFLFHKKQTPQQIAQQKPIDIKPGSQKAILQLSNGQQIALNEAPAGKLAQQGNATVTKTADGRVTYDAQNTTNSKEDIYNTITTQRGGYYPLKMADGTIAILDAQSSIKYPVTFNGKERKVEITGQVYFEVKHDAAHPFKVMVRGQTIEDLGTAFNINAYEDEPVIRTTLVEGSIAVSKNDQSATIKPGQQAITLSANNTITIKEVNTRDAIAWKNGRTSFKDENIQEIMRQVSRWYDVDIHYEGAITKRTFVGDISRNVNLSDLLAVLEFNNIHFKLEGKTLIVKP